MKKINVDIPGSEYPVYLGYDIFIKLNNLISKHKLHRNILIIVDSNVDQLYKEPIEKLIKDNDQKLKKIKISAKESNKSFQSMQKVFDYLIKNNFGRDTLIIALGGGIIGDLAGFIASSYMRGVQYIQVPTTLLAAVDSSVGGKTAVNFGETKNVIGAFYQPDFVLIDQKFFETLGEEELICGIGEILKYAFLTDNKTFNYFSKNLNSILKLEKSVLSRLVQTSVNYKAAVVIEDEKENGVRKLLNLGHTFAHAFEVEQKHKIKHGQAVILGITCALYLSNKMNFISDIQLEKALSLLVKFRGKIEIKKYNLNMLYKIMLRDKKNRNNKIKFVLPAGVGDILLDVEADKEDVFYAIKNGIGLFH